VEHAVPEGGHRLGGRSHQGGTRLRLKEEHVGPRVRLPETHGHQDGVGVDVHVRNVADPGEHPEPEEASDLRARLVERLDGDFTVVVMNGDERELVSTRLASELGQAGRTIGYPAWELQRYPETWARELEHCDEVWAVGHVRHALSAQAVTHANYGRLGHAGMNHLPPDYVDAGGNLTIPPGRAPWASGEIGRGAGAALRCRP
jgi:hypothetical protein